MVVSEDGRTLTVRVPLAHRKRGGRKLVVAPDGGEWKPARPQVDSVMIKAIARGHRWRRMLESGEFSTIQELAASERINASYLGRLLRLTLLAPTIVEAILDGRQLPGLQLDVLMSSFPVAWHRQNHLSGL